MRRARAATDISRARVEQARSGYLPSLTGTASYLRQTRNTAPTGISTGFAPSSPSNNSYNAFNFRLQASQLIYDFGQTDGRWRAADATVESTQQAQRTQLISVLLTVKRAYYTARANKALVTVAEETLANQQKHLQQIQAFVLVGTRPEIDAVQARTDFANSRLSLITAQNDFENSKAGVNQAMGIIAGTDFDVADDDGGAVVDEDEPLDNLVKKAIAQRPELLDLTKQRRAQELTVRAEKGGYGPALSANAEASAAGAELDGLVHNWSVGATLTWPILSGWKTHGVVHEAEAKLSDIDAQLDGQQLQIGLDVQQGWLSVRAGKASIAVAREVLANAREQLRLAEGRYGAGTGSVIELGDAQVAATKAAVGVVQADYNLATARAQLLAALGR